MFAFQEIRGAVEVAFTDRHGGVSGGRYASLNLGGNGLEDRATVEANLDIVGAAFARGSQALDTLPEATDFPLVVGMRQVHGAHVAVVDEATASSPRPPVADALVSALPGVVLMVRVADCVPVLLADVERGLVGAAHAGRAGMVAGIVPNTVAAIRGLGGDQLVAWVGPHVCGGCYEVPEQMRAQVCAVVPEADARTTWGTPSVDIGAGVRAQLERAGVTVVDASRCTMEDEDLYSYRRQGKESGRLAGLVRVRR